MFDNPNWSSGDEEKSPAVPPPKKKLKKNKKSASTTSLDSLKSLGSEKLKTFSSKVKKKMDQCFNSPSLTKNLVSDDGDEAEIVVPKKKFKSSASSNNEPGAILRKGIKFENEKEFDEYMFNVNSPVKKKKKKKRKKKSPEKKEEEKPEITSKSEEKLVKSDSEKKPKFNIDKLKDLLHHDNNSKNNNAKKTEEITSSTTTNRQIPKENDHLIKLKSSQFRHLNEQLYTQTGSQSLKMFKNDPKSFKVYHEGFRNQAEKWPVDPLNLIITSIMKMNTKLTIADFGCGEARLARTLGEDAKVHSFDLVKMNDYVTVCDFANTPLENESCDVVVFCLSLMGTNLKEFLREANRVLKTNGVLKIAEVASRFKNLPIEEFIDLVNQYGFKIKWKETKHEYFYLMDFKRVSICKKKLPDLKLKPCFYKKR